jgi:hypothetical protein
LLAAVDVVRGAGDCRVGHEVDGEGGDVGRTNNAPDGREARSCPRRVSSCSPRRAADDGVERGFEAAVVVLVISPPMAVLAGGSSR